MVRQCGLAQLVLAETGDALKGMAKHSVIIGAAELKT